MEREIKIKVLDKDLKGNYANLMRVSHTKEEFFLDFANILPGQDGVIVSRIITNPGHFKRMVLVLNDNLKKYEENFGKIEESQDLKTEFGFKV